MNRFKHGPVEVEIRGSVQTIGDVGDGSLPRDKLRPRRLLAYHHPGLDQACETFRTGRGGTGGSNQAPGAGSRRALTRTFLAREPP